MESLSGGRPNQIQRQNTTVRRPAGAWTPHAQRLLRHLHDAGFQAVPEPLGWDETYEWVSFLPGAVAGHVGEAVAGSETTLQSAAHLLRAYHDATVTFLPTLTGTEPWYLPPQTPAEVMCHGDFAPYNVVLRAGTAAAIIDFDTVHPGPRAWDIAYALYRWAPLTRPDSPEGLGSEAVHLARARAFCEAYGLGPAGRAGLIELTIERLQALVAFMHARAAGGDGTFQGHIAAGHDQIYQMNIAYLTANEAQFQAELAQPK